MINAALRPATGALTFLVSCTLFLATACSDSSDGSGNAAAQARYEVEVFQETYVDETRGTPATGEYPALPDRTLETTIVMPRGGGDFPLLVFSHGLGSSPRFYASLIEEVAAAGFVVVAPLFPLTGENAPAGADPADTPNQPGDVSFLIDTVTAAAASSRPPFDQRTNTGLVGTFGHSNGGITTLGIVANRRCSES